MDEWLVLIESNTTGSGRLFCARARGMGLRPVLLAADPGRYPYLASDGIDSRVVDTASVPAVLDACAGLGGRIAGVLSSSEYHIGTAARVARALGLPHPDPEAIGACRDKSRQRTILRDAGLPGPEFAVAHTASAAGAAAARIGLPVVVKPVAGSGSIATRLCGTVSEVHAAAAAALDVGTVLVERYLDGPEFSVETLDGRAVGVVAKHLGPAPHFVEIGHDYPAPLPAADTAALVGMAEAALAALGLGWGAAHVELRLTAHGPRIVEVNPRLAGGMIPRMIEAASGLDLIGAVVARAAGRVAARGRARAAAAAIRFLVARQSGRLAEVSGVEQARGLPGVVEAGLTRSAGEDLVLTNSFRDRIGYVITAGPDLPAAARAAEEALGAIRMTVVPDEISVAIVGLGSRGLGVLERIVTLAGRRGPSLGRVRVELIDPRCDGAGVHAVDQPDYLLLNTTCAQVSLFPDANTVGELAGEPGPSLYEWVTERGLRLGADGCTVGPEGRPIRPTDFLPRRLLGEYLGWFLDQIMGRAPEHVDITLRRAAAVDMSEVDGQLMITLSDNATVRAGYAFLTTGYTSNSRAAATVGPYPLPSSLDRIRAGETVAIAGFGLSAMDVIASLTVGRGGRFTGPANDPRYEPSGAEPAMLIYSRSGVPCRARPKVVVFGPPYRPLVFTPDGADRVRAARGGGPLDFDRDVLPLVLTEIRIAYRRCEARLAGRAAELEAALAAAGGPAGITELLDSLDVQLGQFDAAAVFDGTADMPLENGDTYQKWLGDTIRADLADSELGFTASPVKAGLDVLRALRDTFRHVVDFGGLTPESLDTFTAVTIPALNRAVVGPQFERHVELLALLSAGVLRTPFGPAPAVRHDPGTGRWTITSTALAEPCSLAVDWLIPAHVELPGVRTSSSPLIRALHRRGWIRPHRPHSRLVPGVDIDPDQHPIGADGTVRPRIWILGPLCEGATFYNNLVPSPNVWSRPVADAHRCVVELLTHAGSPDLVGFRHRPPQEVAGPGGGDQVLPLLP